MEDLNNKFFDKALKRARELFGNPEKLKKTLDKALKKVININGENGEIKTLVDKVKIFIRMIKAYVNGEYTEIPWRTLLLMTGGLLYFINPFDLIPDFLPGLGYLDDITVILWIFKSVEDDIISFHEYFYT